MNREFRAIARIRRGDPIGKWSSIDGNPTQQRQLLLLLHDLPQRDLEWLARAGIYGEMVTVTFSFSQLELSLSPDRQAIKGKAVEEGTAAEASVSTNSPTSRWEDSQEYQGFRVGESVRTSTNDIGIIQDISYRDRRNPVLMVRLEQGLGDLVPVLPADLEHIAQ